MFDARGEQIQRMDYLAQRRRFEEEMARSAPQLDYLDPDEEEEESGAMDGINTNEEWTSQQREGEIYS